MFDYEVYGIALLPIIIGLVQLVKGFRIPNKYMPIVSIIIAEAISIFFMMNGDTDYKKAILVGLQLGLAATGLYSGVKNITQKNKYKNKGPK